MKGKNLLLMFLVLAISVFFLTGCESDSESGSTLSYTTIEINQEYPETIEAFGTKVYRINIPASGNYNIGIKDLGSDCSIVVCDYVSGAETLDDLEDFVLWIIDANDDNTNENQLKNLEAKSYFIVVDEWDDIASSYTLYVKEEGLALKSVNTSDSGIENTDLNNKNFNTKWF